MSDNPSAFPVNTGNSQESGAFYPESGMTLRDYFAGQALSALLHGNSWTARELADDAYRAADAMLAERAKK